MLRPMRLDHGSLPVSDAPRALVFSAGALGLPEVPRPPTFDAPGAWLQAGDQQIHLVGEAEPGRARTMQPGYDREEIVIGYNSHLALVVDDLDAALERARAHGVEPPGEIIARGDGGRRTFATAPDGHVIELMEKGVAVTGDEPRLKPPRR